MNIQDWFYAALGRVKKADEKKKPMKVQSLIFSKDKFKSAEDAKSWAKQHDFKFSGVDETGSSFRLRQENPGNFKKMRTIEMTDGVKAVVGKAFISKSGGLTSSQVHVKSPELVIPAQHKQPVRLSKTGQKLALPNKTAGELHQHILGQLDNVGGTIRTGSKTGSDISPLDGIGSSVSGVSEKSSERFTFGPMVFDIDKARDMGGKEQNAVAGVSPDWSHRINVDTKAALKSKSDNPVMIAQIPTTNGVEPLLIDGHHRMFKALHEGKDELPAHIFSPEETIELMDAPPDVKDQMRKNMASIKPTVSTENPGDGTHIDPKGRPPGGDGSPVGKDIEDEMSNARSEIALLSDPAIELKTAHKWAARAIAAFEQGDLTQAEDYGHEALEHAALVKDGGKSVGEVENYLRAAGLYKSVSKADLGYSERQRLHDASFAIPSERKYPIHDIAHARNALARVAQHGTPAERKKVQDAVYRKYPSLKPEAAEKTQSFAGAHSSDILKDTEEGLQGDISVNGFNNAGGRSSGGMGDNVLAGMYNMQSVVDGMDWELEHNTTSPDLAKEQALAHLQDDPLYYDKKRQMEDSVDWSSGWGLNGACKGLKVDLGSGSNRESGHLGFDLVKHDHGTIVHDLNLGIPLPTASCKSVVMRNALHDMDCLSDDPKPILSEIQRVLMPGGQFVYEGPNQIQNQPQWLKETWSEKFQHAGEGDSDAVGGLIKRAFGVSKIEGKPYFRQEFARVAAPDAATANDSEPRIGVAQYDMLPADALLAMDALGYYWSDATSSGRGNRLHGYPSQGALVKTIKDEEETHEANPPVADSMTDMGPGRGFMKRAIGKTIPICKTDGMKQIAYGVVLAPNEVDLQEDVMTPDEIEKTAHFFMMNGRTIGKDHSQEIKAVPIESYIAPVDFEYDGQYGNQQVKKGSWVLGVKVLDPEVWEKIQNGEYTGFSVGGWGQRSDLEQKQW